MAWLKDEVDDLYYPDYTDMLRVSFTYKFKLGRLQDLVYLLAGRILKLDNTETQLPQNLSKNLAKV